MKRPTSTMLIVLVLGTLLAGCAGTAPVPTTSPTSKYSSEVARSLQSEVLAVTESAANDDPAAALDRLDHLLAIVAEANARGEFTASRLQSIESAIAAVRADLEAAIANQQPSRKPGKSGKNGEGD